MCVVSLTAHGNWRLPLQPATLLSYQLIIIVLIIPSIYIPSNTKTWIRVEHTNNICIAVLFLSFSHYLTLAVEGCFRLGLLYNFYNPLVISWTDNLTASRTVHPSTHPVIPFLICFLFSPSVVDVPILARRPQALWRVRQGTLSTVDYSPIFYDDNECLWLSTIQVCRLRRDQLHKKYMDFNYLILHNEDSKKGFLTIHLAIYLYHMN